MFSPTIHVSWHHLVLSHHMYRDAILFSHTTCIVTPSCSLTPRVSWRHLVLSHHVYRDAILFSHTSILLVPLHNYCMCIVLHYTELLIYNLYTIQPACTQLLKHANFYTEHGMQCLSYNIYWQELYSTKRTSTTTILILVYLHFREDFYLIAYGSHEWQFQN